MTFVDGARVVRIADGRPGVVVRSDDAPLKADRVYLVRWDDRGVPAPLGISAHLALASLGPRAWRSRPAQETEYGADLRAAP